MSPLIKSESKFFYLIDPFPSLHKNKDRDQLDIQLDLLLNPLPLLQKLGILVQRTPKTKGKKGLCVVIVESLDISSINATRSMDILVVISLNGRIQWPIKCQAKIFPQILQLVQIRNKFLLHHNNTRRFLLWSWDSSNNCGHGKQCLFQSTSIHFTPIHTFSK